MIFYLNWEETFNRHHNEKTIKQQLREKTKDHKITMGVISVKNTVTGKQLNQGSLNLGALVNKIKFQLNSGQLQILICKKTGKNSEMIFLLLNSFILLIIMKIATLTIVRKFQRQNKFLFLK